MLNIKNELEAKLREEKQHAENLSSQLETMQQLQELDLASSSLLATETSQVTYVFHNVMSDVLNSDIMHYIS